MVNPLVEMQIPFTEKSRFRKQPFGYEFLIWWEREKFLVAKEIRVNNTLNYIAQPLKCQIYPFLFAKFGESVVIDVLNCHLWKTKRKLFIFNKSKETFN